MLAKKYDFLESEKKWQRYWEEEGIFRFDPAGEGPIYSIDTPPPTVSGSIHIGHIYSYTHAEIIARYQRMKGQRVFYPFGFDDNGLPTERLVEREAGIKAAALPREEFQQLCLATTARYEAQFKELWQSLGFSVDWDLKYSTIDENSMRISQLSFLDLYKKGKIYQNQNPVLWCTECQTAIAQAEIESKELETYFNYLIFHTTSGEELTIATTRPELLPACVAILIHPADERYSQLIGAHAIVPLTGEEIPIIGDEEVDIEKGSGIVMCCTFGDQQDIIWWRRHQLPLKEMIDAGGRILAGFGKYSGLELKTARAAILTDLETAGRLLKKAKMVHQVACHERCGKPIEYLTSRQWFIRIIDEKERLLKAADEITWHPEYMKHRYQEWVNNLEWDWSISRQRYFGIPFPLWYCAECGEIILAEAEDLPINPLKDNPRGTCSQCGSRKFIPEKDVMDTWATSSVTPLINARWNGKDCQYPLLPMSLRPQAHEIIRTWAFYTIAKSLFHFGQIPWKDIMISGFVMAKAGEKISKSKSNSTMAPEELISRYSADVIRLWTSQAKLGTDIFFVEDEVRNNQRLPIKLWNAARFVLGHLDDLDWQSITTYEDTCGDQSLEDQGFEPMDEWLLHKLMQTHADMTRSLETFEISQARMTLDKFFWNDFCDNYLEIIKERLYKPEIRGEKNRRSAQRCLYIAFLNILKMYAIFMPHLTEEIYQDYFKDPEGLASIHRLNWNRYTRFNLAANALTGGEEFIELATQIRRYKSEQGISLGAELKDIELCCTEENLPFLKKAAADLKAVLRAEKLTLQATTGEPTTIIKP